MVYLMRVLTCTGLDLVLLLDLVLVFTAASAQIAVHVSEGDDAVLPCTFLGGSPPHSVSVYWKDKRDDLVLTIKNFIMDLQNQSPRYQDRVQSFPSQYKDGNFSLVLKKVNWSDSGVFECHIMPDEFQRNVRLNVTISGKRGSDPSGSRVGSSGSGVGSSGSGVGSSGSGVGSSGSGVGSSGPSGGSSVASPHLLLLLPLLLSVFV